MSKLLIEKSAMDKIHAYTALCPDEISGLGRVMFIDNNPVVIDVVIFDQVVSAAHSTIDPLALAKFQDERVKAGESMKEWVLWWHSHANMSVFFSGTDTNTIESSTEFPHLVSLVVNKKKEAKARLDVYSPVHMWIDLDIEVIETPNADVIAHCQTEIDAKVKKHVRTTYVPKKKNTNIVEYGPREYGSMSDYYHAMGDDDGVGGKGFLSLSGKDDDRLHDINQTGAGFKTYDDDRNLDALAADEYMGHKRHLIKQIRKAELKRKTSRAEKLREELAAHMTWGRSVGLEITKAAV